MNHLLFSQFSNTIRYSQPSDSTAGIPENQKWIMAGVILTIGFLIAIAVWFRMQKSKNK